MAMYIVKWKYPRVGDDGLLNFPNLEMAQKFIKVAEVWGYRHLYLDVIKERDEEPEEDSMAMQEVEEYEDLPF